MQKGFAPILIILLIALAVGGYSIYSNYLNNQTKPTPQPTTHSTPQPSPSPADEIANWKTYTNTKYGFSLKYPPTYILLDSGVGTPCIVSSQDKLNNSLSQGICINVSLADIYTNYEQASMLLIQNYEKDNTGKIPQHKIEEPDKITIIKGPYSFPEAKLENVYERTTYWKYKGGAVTAGYHNVNKNEADIYDQILSTFKFTQ